jgi:DNA (cytosine-5)-methyltransferase 1
MKVVELFTGAGGLALGLSRAGFLHQALVERDVEACGTIRENQRRQVQHVTDWPLYQGDVRELRYTSIDGDIDLLAAGAPCQPFSFAGKRLGQLDDRNMFPEVLRGVLELSPRAVLIENVKGLTSTRFAEYFEYVLLRTAFPHLAHGEDEPWRDHLSRLKEHSTSHPESARYRVSHAVLNAADYGVPQWRERVFIVAFRSDLDLLWEPPAATHSMDALLKAQWHERTYWERHGIPAPKRAWLTKRLRDRLRELRRSDFADAAGGLPWRTIRDAISDLPRVRVGGEAETIANHFLNPGARKYEKHTGSRMDEPAKTLKAGSHGVPGGENILGLPHGRVRYFSVRECARLQTFPDDFVFSGPWTRCMRQLGNAVPVTLAEVVARSVHAQLEKRGRVDVRLKAG